MDWCRGCGSSRPVPATRREFPTNNLLLTPCKGCSKCEHAGQQSAGQGRTEPSGAGQGGRAGRAGRAGQGLEGAGRKAQGAGQRLWGQSRAEGRHQRGRWAGRRAGPCRAEGRPGSPHRLVETLGGGASVGASSAHANGQRSPRQFRV